MTKLIAFFANPELIEQTQEYVEMRHIYVAEKYETAIAGGPNTANTWHKRKFNTIISNNIEGASLANDEVTLPAGKYYVEVSTPFYRTNFAYACVSLNGMPGSTEPNQYIGPTANSSATDGRDSQRATVQCFITLAEPKNISVHLWTDATSGAQGTLNGGLGVQSRIHSEMTIVKIGV